MSADAEPALEPGRIDRDLAEELPGLRLVTAAVPAPPTARAPRALRGRLRELSGRWHGARAVTMRREPVPHAYRVLFRHLGLDPDEQRTPIEQAVMDRLVRGGFAVVSGGLLADALLLALVETGVPVWALDDERVDGPLGLRPARPGERLGEGPLAGDVPPGRVVVADARAPVAVLFGAIAPAAVPSRATARLRLFAVAAPGVPALHVEEAIWTVTDTLAAAGPPQ